MNPDPDVDLAAGKLAEDHADLLRPVDGDQPGRLFGVDATDGGADLVVEITCGRTRAVARRTHVVGARGEDVAVLAGRERPQHQVLSRAHRLLAQ